MEKLFFFFLFLIHGIHGATSNYSSTPKHYIVYMGTHSLPNSEAVISSNHELLASVVGSVGDAHQATVHHYHKSFRGFSAMLTPEQANQIEKSDSVISVFESTLHKLHTTRSWEFMQATGNHSIFSNFAVYGDYDVIIGHMDSGIWPEAPSFDPSGLGPVPSRFKGECVTGENFYSWHCNRKLIGARYYYEGFERSVGPLESIGRKFYRSPRDDFGHGSHTASTAAGSLVTNIPFIRGTSTQIARGGAPNARLAIYKVCWFNYCTISDIMKAFDDAIHDKVDLITISVGAKPNQNIVYTNDGFSIAAFHAFTNGILTSASAGNDGLLGSFTVENSAPWTLTVAASSISRDFVSTVQLGNGIAFEGYGINRFQTNGYYGVIAAGYAALDGVSTEAASFCKENTLNIERIRGKIVVCSMKNEVNDVVEEKAKVVAAGGGVGIILVDGNGLETIYENSIPTCVINQQGARSLQDYLSSTREPMARISRSMEKLNTKHPMVASFSSKGPDKLTPESIKPDITAPGVNILAAWPSFSLTNNVNAPTFHVDSGTSMACPHVSGVAAMVKALHPNWSPAEIKSALMTTAKQFDNTGQPIRSITGLATPFDMGSGHLDPNAALNPGLVYDMGKEDVFYFLCDHGINERMLQNIFGGTTYCPRQNRPYDLNLPSIGINNLIGGTSVSRRVTYRGKKNDPTIFEVEIEHPEGVYVEVRPNVLDFSDGQETKSFTVNFYVRENLGRPSYGYLTWYNRVHTVRSPIAIINVA
ncbi:Subtilisin-like protease [Actinidia chinensis var. chinensis]|uniref:Subtilisin-like protease n=1 Tax=Actinidia chinensis var. chinensis TaxID=1590841 RepID=A0A2R6QW00_ACTCC|nr:Subtilisin-like protease [Actinidia chinensis var. chinensis]